MVERSEDLVARVARVHVQRGIRRVRQGDGRAEISRAVVEDAEQLHELGAHGAVFPHPAQPRLGRIGRANAVEQRRKQHGQQPSLPLVELSGPRRRVHREPLTPGPDALDVADVQETRERPRKSRLVGQ